MKAKLTTLLLFISIAITSCNTTPQEDTNDLLTSTGWTVEPNQLKNGPEHQLFNRDGTYVYDFGNMKVTGQWKWTAKNEIYVEYKTITLNGVEDKFDGKQNFYVRILEVSEDKLKTLERFETDSWDSGFAKERNYKRI